MTIALDHTALRSAAGDVRGASLAIGAERRSLDRHVQGLLDGAWTGAAAESFGEAWEQWQAGAAEVVGALGAMAELIDATHGDLTDQDATTLVTLQAIGLRMAQRLGGEL